MLAGLGWRRLVYAAIAVYGLGSIALVASGKVGRTAEHLVLAVAIGAVVVDRSRSWIAEWLPFLFVGVIYEDLHGVAGMLGSAVHALGPAALERRLFGGTAATWLQIQLGPPGAIHWYTLLMVAEYLAHFAAPLAAGLWLWTRHRDRFRTFVNAYFLLMTIGFVVYVIFPEMPPWLASQRGLVPNVHRLVVTVLQHLGSIGAIYAGADPYPDGAMPSLHVGVPMVIASMAIVLSRRRLLRWLWLLYPLTMAFAVVYLGEHYVADALAGLAFGLLSFVIIAGLRWAQRPGVKASASVSQGRRPQGTPVLALVPARSRYLEVAREEAHRKAS